ncbi:hypothetical protein KIN20_034543 [Parelaphostrongylus tenuis]|uniref:Uncharacterized protein n=1 Tax=Parelaphostrongylus tenuis TaxID=148309 RepID=A0AAD5WJR4_PARTN|nr:hypothetical protein KIN20_034543 [Parelaphostrongylus tenuis]
MNDSRAVTPAVPWLTDASGKGDSSLGHSCFGGFAEIESRGVCQSCQVECCQVKLSLTVHLYSMACGWYEQNNTFLFD